MRTSLRKVWRWLRTPQVSLHWTAVRGPYKGAVVGVHFTRLFFILLAAVVGSLFL